MPTERSYREKFKDPRWQKKRLEVLERANWRCEICGADGEQLDVHHIAYFRRTEPWEYADWIYQVLCRSCHEGRQEIMDKIKAAVALDLKAWSTPQLARHLEKLSARVMEEIEP